MITRPITRLLRTALVTSAGTCLTVREAPELPMGVVSIDRQGVVTGTVVFCSLLFVSRLLFILTKDEEKSIQSDAPSVEL